VICLEAISLGRAKACVVGSLKFPAPVLGIQPTEPRAAGSPEILRRNFKVQGHFRGETHAVSQILHVSTLQAS